MSTLNYDELADRLSARRIKSVLPRSATSPAEVLHEERSTQNEAESTDASADDSRSPHGDGPRSASDDIPSLMTAGQRLGVAGAVFLTLFLGAVAILFDLGTLRAAAVSLFLFCGVGTGPLLVFRPIRPIWFVLLSVTGSLTTTIMLGLAMALTHQWHPMGMFSAAALGWSVLAIIGVVRDTNSVRTADASSEDTGTTSANWDLPGDRTAAVTPDVASRCWTLHFADGSEIAVSGDCVVGRDPSQVVEGASATLVTVPDPSSAVSPSHLLLRQIDGDLVLIDQGSSNGTTLTTSDGESLRCAPLAPVTLADRDIISVGSHWFGDVWFEVRLAEAAA